MIKPIPQVLISKQYFQKFKEGNEQGLEYFYNQLYKTYAYRSERYVKCDCMAASIAHEAFLRLWLVRDSIESVEHMKEFIGKQVREAGSAYYRKSTARFQRSLFQLDGIEDYQEFMMGYEMEEAYEEDTVFLEEIEKYKKEQLDKLNALLPNLSEQQQLFVRLCLKYSFSYDRIGWHLGGISDYEVAKKVENTIAVLKAALSDSRKLDIAMRPKKIDFEGELNEEQAQIFQMRYELQYSFEEISEALNLKDSQVKKLFISAYAVIGKNKIN